MMSMNASAGIGRFAPWLMRSGLEACLRRCRIRIGLSAEMLSVLGP